MPRTRRLISLLTVISIGLLSLLPVPSTHATLLTGFGNVARVNNPPMATSGLQVEPSIAANPTNPYNLVAAYMDESYPNVGCVAYTSNSLTTSWSSQTLLESAWCGDPVVRFDPSGNAWVVYLVTNYTAGSSTLYYRESIGGSGSWGSRLLAVPPGVVPGLCGDGYDKPWLAADPTGSNKLYVSYTDVNVGGIPCGPPARYQIKLARFDGTSWVSVDVTPLQTNVVGGSNVAVAPNGDVLVAWYDAMSDGPDTGQMQIRFARSTNHGNTFSAPTTIATAFETQKKLPSLNWTADGTMYPKIVVGPNPSNSSYYNAYVVYGARPLNQGQGTDEADIYFTNFTSSGVNWSAPFKLNDDGSNTPQFFPSIAVDAGPDGKMDDLHVTYADMSVSTGTPPTQYVIRQIQSDNAGGNWRASQLVTSQSSNSACCGSLGDYFDIAVGGGYVTSIWTDTRSGDADIYTGVGYASPTSFTLTAASYSLSFMPSSDTGGSVSTTLTATLTSIVTSPVWFSSSGAPYFMTVSFSSSPVSPTATSVVTFSVGPGYIFRSSHTYNIVITVTGISEAHSVTIAVTVQQNCFCIPA